MLSKLSALILKLWGWKITGQYPFSTQKVILAVAPHTSNWDFPVGVLVNSALRSKANYVAKHTIFIWPLGYLLRWLGGIPVDRRAKGNFVASVVEAFDRRGRVHLAIAPEGTRSKVEKFKTGFYHIAKGAGAAICLVKFDWERMEVFFDPKLFYPTDDETADMRFLWDYFKNVKGRNPELGVG